MGKKTAYALICLGVFVMLLSGFLMWRVFAGAEEPPMLFHAGILSLSLKFGQVELPVPEQLVKAVNMGAHYLCMLFILFTGTRISNAGVQLVRALNTQAKDSDK